MKFADSVKQSASLTSTATITLGAVVPGYQTLAQAIANTAGKPEQVAVGDVVCMRVDDTADATKFEIGDYTIGGTSSAPTLTRGTIRTSSAGGSAVTFSGSVTVLCTVPSNYLVGSTIGQLPTTVAQSSIAGADLFELEQSGVSGKLSVDTHYAYLVARMQAAGLFTGGSGNTGGTTATAPGAPTIGTATAGDGGGTWAFTAPSSNGGVAITGYTLTVYKASDNSAAGTFTGTGSPIAATGLTNGTGYYGKVAATNSAGTGVQSAASNTVTPVAAAAAGTPYTVTNYYNAAPNSTIDASGKQVYNGARFIPDQDVWGGNIYWNVKRTSDGVSATSAQSGWSSSSTVPPSGTQSQGVNGLRTMNNNTSPFSDDAGSPAPALWVPVGTATGKWYFWILGNGGVPVCVTPNGVTVSGA